MPPRTTPATPPGQRHGVAHRFVLAPMAMAAALLALPCAGVAVTPLSAHVSGGVRVKILDFSGEVLMQRAYFGGQEGLDFVDGIGGCTELKGGFCVQPYYVTVPPAAQAGTVELVLEYTGGFRSTHPEPFTYFAAPVIERVTPGQNSILPDDDNEPVTIRLEGASLAPGLRVFFGGRPASQVALSENGLEITCLPPPFPGGPHPLPVEVRVVNADGSEGAAMGMFEYARAAPEFLGFTRGHPAQPWIVDQVIAMQLDKVVGDSVSVYVDSILAKPRSFEERGEYHRVSFYAPAHAPGLVDITIVNGDGGAYIGQDEFYYTGEPSTDFHPGDLDENFRFNLSEVLRVVQLFNSDGYHCDASGEDGYAPGPGDQSCAPYPADTAPQDWQLGLEELLQIIQFYNLHCYQPCPAAPGTYCPPNPPQF